MHNGIMAYRNVITYISRMLLISSMQHSAVLYVYLISYLDIMYITAYNSVEPYTAL
ncbi:hypothetical protein D3C72_2560840 [compost metagenome]